MKDFLKFFEGKKTHFLVLAYVILTLATGDKVGGDALAGLDPDAIRDALLGLMVSTGKAAWARYADS